MLVYGVLTMLWTGGRLAFWFFVGCCNIILWLCGFWCGEGLLCLGLGCYCVWFDCCGFVSLLLFVIDLGLVLMLLGGLPLLCFAFGDVFSVVVCGWFVLLV